jgi:hypothetical protein
MRKIFFGLAILSLAACSNGEQKQATGTGTLPTSQSGSQPQANLLTNPEHGQPGHDCALPVGAPLKQSSTAQPAAVPASTQPVSVPTTPPPAPSQPVSAPSSTTSAKLNPAHGQPGHDCALPVGAPLK